MISRFARRTAAVAAAAGALALTALVAGPLAGRGSAAAVPCPHRIVSISPTGTETLFAIGAGRAVVAVDSDSNYPASAPRKAGLIAYSPSATAIYADYRPDLVVVSYDANKVIEQLHTLHVRVIFQPTAPNLRSAYRQMLDLGTATCHRAQAGRLVASIQSQIAGIRHAVGTRARGLLYFDEISAPPYLYAASSRSFMGQLFSLLGMRNISNDPSGFPALNQEQVIKASPQLIFLSDNQPKDGAVAGHAVATRPGWSNIRAVRNHAIYPLNDDAASRWGPRIVVLMHQIAHDALVYRAHH